MKIYTKSSINTTIAKVASDILDVINMGEYDYYGIRVDDHLYDVGDTCYNSHQLFQDPDYDYDGNLIYPYCESGPYEGLYDAGELDGTCAIGIFQDNIETALKHSKCYSGSHMYLLGSEWAHDGNDQDELVMEDAKVLMKIC